MSSALAVKSSEQKYKDYISSKKQNLMTVPKISKISLTISIGAADKKDVAKVVDELTMLAGQKAITSYAKKSISSFKLREGMPVGASVTLRKKKMYDFIDRLVYIALPRIRDFRGLKSSSIDGSFNYAIGIKDYGIFPEVSYNTSLSKQIGLGISFTIKNSTSKNDTVELLKTFDLPVK
ncbi:50S ribosomal protein L5 [bacterium]|nr:50S ribosomal protein L5 [bacterium]